jgi:hypothetical protein
MLNFCNVAVDGSLFSINDRVITVVPDSLLVMRNGKREDLSIKFVLSEYLTLQIDQTEANTNYRQNYPHKCPHLHQLYYTDVCPASKKAIISKIQLNYKVSRRDNWNRITDLLKNYRQISPVR